MWLDEFHPELPPAFKVWCDCGWQGRYGRGGAYVIGMQCPMDLCFSVSQAHCPKCDKKIHRLLGLDDFKARYRYVVEQLGYKIDRAGDSFSCTCEIKPACQIISEIHLVRSVCNDTVFVSDREWLRTIARVRCNGCCVKGLLAWLEEIPADLFWRQQWVYEYKWARDWWAIFDN